MRKESYRKERHRNKERIRDRKTQNEAGRRGCSASSSKVRMATITWCGDDVPCPGVGALGQVAARECTPQSVPKICHQ